MQDRFRSIISLGGRCQVAHQLHRIFPRSDIAFPFDWLITSNSGLLSLLARRFEHLISGELLVEADTNRPDFHHKHVLNQKYNALISHAFLNSMPISAAIVQVHEKYEFLIQRWQRT